METMQALAALSALAQATRLAIYRLLVEAGPDGLPVGEIGEEVGVAPATLSFHLRHLSHAGLIVPRQDGRFIFYAAAYARMNALLRFLTENCCNGNPAICLDPCIPTKPSRPRRAGRQGRRGKPQHS